MGADDLMTGPASSGPCANRHAGRLWAGLIPPAVWLWSLWAVPELTCGLLSSPVGAVPRDGGDGVVRRVGRRHAGDPARQGRRCNAKVTPELASSGYCPTQHRYDHGVKVHVVGDFQPGTLPSPRFIGLAPSRGYVNPSSPSSIGSRRKPALRWPARCVLPRVFSSMSSGAWPPLCLCGMSCRKALNSH